jgi:putative transposase
LLAVAEPTAALESLMPWVAQEDATASRGSCARSDSSLGNALSIDPLPLIAATADLLPLIAFELLPCSGSIRSWATDATCVLTGQGWLYLVAVLDLFSRRVVGWAMSQLLDAPLAIAALRMALSQRRPTKSLIVHSDRGSQFASAAYRQLLTQQDLIPSMARKGNCYDNAFIESFFSSLKYELVYHHRFATLSEARTAIFHYIEAFYNRSRLHSSLDYQSPSNFESQLNQNYP